MAPVTDERSDIFVYQTNTGEYRVEPGTFVTSGERLVAIRNLTSLDVTVRPPSRWSRESQTIPPGARDVFAIPRVPGGVYFYHVLVGGFFAAVGHSEPTIIVDP